MEMKHMFNEWLDSIFEKKREDVKFKPLENKEIDKALNDAKLVELVIKGKANNPVSKLIIWLSGWATHVTTVVNTEKCSLPQKELKIVYTKLNEYYGKGKWEFPKYLVLSSADDNGMNMFSIARYQNREMAIFDITDRNSNKNIKDLINRKVSDAPYDYIWLFGKAVEIITYFVTKSKQLSRWIIRLFDDDAAWGCSEQEQILYNNGTKVSDRRDPSPTDMYKYLKKHWPVIYNNLPEDIK